MTTLLGILGSALTFLVAFYARRCAALVGSLLNAVGRRTRWD